MINNWRNKWDFSLCQQTIFLSIFANVPLNQWKTAVIPSPAPLPCSRILKERFIIIAFLLLHKVWLLGDFFFVICFLNHTSLEPRFYEDRFLMQCKNVHQIKNAHIHWTKVFITTVHVAECQEAVKQRNNIIQLFGTRGWNHCETCTVYKLSLMNKSREQKKKNKETQPNTTKMRQSSLPLLPLSIIK